VLAGGVEGQLAGVLCGGGIKGGHGWVSFFFFVKFLPNTITTSLTYKVP